MKLVVYLTAVALAAVAGPRAPSVSAAAADAAPAMSDTSVLRSVDNMHFSRDLMCTQQTQAWIDSVVAQEATFGVNTIVVDTPYDDASGYSSCPVGDPMRYEAEWVAAIRAAHLHVWFRQIWNSWHGIYGQPKLTYGTTPPVPYEPPGGAGAAVSGADRQSYLGKTYQFILQHAGLFASGDIFTPQEEPDDATVPPNCNAPCQFPNAHEFNRFLRDSVAVDRQAFTALGLSVMVGYWGIDCTKRLLEPETLSTLQGVMATDCYQRSAADLKTQLSALYLAYGVPVVLGEWGDIWDRGAEPASMDAVSGVFSDVRTLPFIVGFNYWQAAGTIGSEDILNPEGVGLTGVGYEVRPLMEHLRDDGIFAAGPVGTLPVWLFAGECMLGGQQTGGLSFACRFHHWNAHTGRGSPALGAPSTAWTLVR